MSTVDVSNDGKISAFVTDGHLNIYNVIDNKLIFKVTEKSDVIETKILKLSPSKEMVAWLQITPPQLYIVHIHKQKTSVVKSHPQLPFDYILWSPDGRDLAVFSSLSICIDVYRTEHEGLKYVASINGAREDEFGCPIAQFSPDGEYFFTVNIYNQGYSIKIYYTKNSSWDCIQRLFTSECCGVGGSVWLHDSASMLLWQSGFHQMLQLLTLDGRVEKKLSTDDSPITCVCLSYCGRMGAFHSSNGRVRILDLLTWSQDVTEVLVHCPIVHKSSARSRLKESVTTGTMSVCVPIVDTWLELYQDDTLDHKYCTLMRFNCDAQYLATYKSSIPNTLWIWQLTTDSPLDTVIVLREDTFITEIVWHKEETLLAASLTRGRVLVWSPEKSFIQNHSENPWPLTAKTYFATLSMNKYEIF